MHSFTFGWSTCIQTYKLIGIACRVNRGRYGNKMRRQINGSRIE